MNNTVTTLYFVTLLVLSMMPGLSTAQQSTLIGSSQSVHVYSYRDPVAVRPLFEAFERETGINVELTLIKNNVAEQLIEEGLSSSADMVFTVDIGRLESIKRAGLSLAMPLAVLESVPSHLRDDDGHWLGLTQRGRVIYVSRDRVDPQQELSYEELADPFWRGRICIRSPRHIYMISHLASMIAHQGEVRAEAWLRGVLSNLAFSPAGGDRDQVRAIMEGRCDVSLGNTYYMGKMLSHPTQYEWARAVRMVFPNQAKTASFEEGRGVMMNVSGLSVLKNAPNLEAVLKLASFLATPTAQQIYAEQNFEYPVSKNVPSPGLTQTWGEFSADTCL